MSDAADARRIAANLERVRERIAVAALRAGRRADDVALIAVTKTVPEERVRAVAAAGVGDLGENRVQELLRKRDSLGDLDARWHLIGTLQRNKVADVVGAVTLIHSVDRLRLAEEISARAIARATVQDVLVQVNTSGEATKHGVAPAGTQSLVEACAALPGLRVRGLMTIAAAGDPDAARRCFASLRTLGEQVSRDVPDALELSMGMTGDLEEAVEEGATMVRVGTAIFGARPVPR